MASTGGLFSLSETLCGALSNPMQPRPLSCLTLQPPNATQIVPECIDILIATSHFICESAAGPVHCVDHLGFCRLYDTDSSLRRKHIELPAEILRVE